MHHLKKLNNKWENGPTKTDCMRVTQTISMHKLWFFCTAVTSYLQTKFEFIFWKLIEKMVKWKKMNKHDHSKISRLELCFMYCSILVITSIAILMRSVQQKQSCDVLMQSLADRQTAIKMFWSSTLEPFVHSKKNVCLQLLQLEFDGRW